MTKQKEKCTNDSGIISATSLAEPGQIKHLNFRVIASLRLYT